MTDRELLELAAKAQGLELDWFPSTRCDLVTKRSIGEVVKMDWNPLTDDGDALRLVVKLEMDISCNGDCSFVTESITNEPAFEEFDEDPYVATRRAIVRAAAEIGKYMK